MKYMILGGRSYLGKSCSQFLTKNNKKVILLNEYNSDFYSPKKLKDILIKEKPNKIIDFKFPIVSSKDEDFNDINLETILSTQERIVESLNELPENNADLYLISTININKRKNIYSKFKKKQEDFYKTFLLEKNNFKILRLENVLGPGDVNTNRLVPYFFAQVFDNKRLSLNINSSKKGTYIFIEDCNKYILNTSLNRNYSKTVFSLTYKDLIFRLSSILEFEYDINHKVLWNGQNIINKKIDKRDRTNRNLIKLTDWYLKNKERLRTG